MRALLKREKRLLILFGVFMAVYLGDCCYRFWRPTIVKETEHYKIYSTATAEQTDEIAEIAEVVYIGYQQLLKQLNCDIKTHPKLKLKLFKNREEFRRCNRIYSWAEAFYREPYCCQYYSADEINPYHWMMHEATHQINTEVAGLKLSQWLDEGLATYVSTSRIINGVLSMGEIDLDTYPVWWFDSMDITGNLEADKQNNSVIPLRAIISGREGPDIDTHFNQYYLHWWSLMHFLMHYESGQYINGLGHLVREGGELSSFEKHIGSIELIEKQWYNYICGLKKTLYGSRPRGNSILS